MPDPNSASALENAAPSAPVETARFRTMPERFTAAPTAVTSPRRWLYLTLGAAAVLAGGIAVAFWLSGPPSASGPAPVAGPPANTAVAPVSQTPAAPAANANTPMAVPAANLNAPTPPTPLAEDLTLAEGRDRKRLSDVLTMQSALSLFYSRYQRYPESLQQLDEFLPSLPLNPKPGGQAYAYQSVNSGAGYQLSFALEVNAIYQGLRLGTGAYQANPLGVLPIGAGPTAASGPSPAAAVPPGPDADQDGLTDAEEQLFSTNPANPDSDGDGYPDGSEVRQLYSPRSPGKRLVDDGLVKSYQDSQYRYRLLYPAGWTAPSAATPGQFSATSQDGDRLSITVEANPNRLSLSEWHAAGNASADLGTFSAVSYAGLNGLAAADGRTVYLASGQQVYRFAYQPGAGRPLDYLTTFQMLLRSFRFQQS